MSAKTIAQILDDKRIQFYWADERDNGSHWVGVADVACSRKFGAVAVPRRRRSAYHWAEVLHEVAHLELWRWKGKSPLQQSDLVACQLALDIATVYGFGADTIEWLTDELTNRLTTDGGWPNHD